MNTKFIKWSTCAVFLTSLSYAQEKDSIPTTSLDEVVISDTKFEQKREKSGKVIERITAKDLEAKKGQSIASVLSQVAGIEINGNQSSGGKDLGIYIRGGRSNQVLILIDGVPVSDASGITISYDLRLLPVEQVESIEVLKGASSTLYGSGAATGVINIKLKKAVNETISGNAYFTLGTQTVAKDANYDPQTFNQGGSINGSTSVLTYFASLNSTDTKGISEARPIDSTTEFEKDHFSRTNAMIKLGFTPTDRFKVDVSGNYDKINSTFDNGPFSDNTENFLTSEQFRIAFLPKYKYNKGELVLNSGANTITRDLFNFGSTTVYKSRSINADLFNKYSFNDEFSLIIGCNFQFFEMSNKGEYVDITEELAHFNMIDGYASVVYNSKFGLNINAGGRYNKHSSYGDYLVYNFNPSYSIPNTNVKVLGSISTAYVTPSLYQLYSSYGDFTLKPQENSTIEAGAEVSFFDKKLKLNTVGFYREEVNSIQFDLVDYKYYSYDGRIKVKGIEANLEYVVSKNITFKTNYTFAELDNFSKVLNPKHKVNTSLGFTYDKFNANVSHQFVYNRYIEYTTYPAPTFDPVLQSDILKDYQLVGANVSYQILKNRMSMFFAADNILDKDFVESRGYSTRGRNFKIGMNFQF